MNTQSLSAPSAQQSTSAPPRAARMILSLLERVQHGALQVTLPDGSSRTLGSGAHPHQLVLADWEIFSASLRSGDIGFAESYIGGHWHTDNLPGLIELLVRNRDEMEALVYGSWWGRLAYRLKHLLNRNTRAGSRKNIHAHYDIGNDFYRLWLDPSMTYSSAVFRPECGGNLALGQQRKYQTILAQLATAPGARVLEIGCGWGGFAEVAARAGLHVTGLTLSPSQLDYARERLAAAGLAQSADLQLCDYRDSEGQYDAIASIEMFEAVGQAYWPSFFDTVARRLKPGGRACIQTIVIDDALFERYAKGSDFIQQYIFPGGMLPSPSEFRRHAKAHGLRVVNELAFGIDYADTLAAWRTSFHARLDAVRAQGFDQRFIRTWEFYLAYCEAAFRAKNTDVMHFTLVRD